MRLAETDRDRAALVRAYVSKPFRTEAVVHPVARLVAKETAS